MARARHYFKQPTANVIHSFVIFCRNRSRPAQTVFENVFRLFWPRIGGPLVILSALVVIVVFPSRQGTPRGRDFVLYYLRLYNYYYDGVGSKYYTHTHTAYVHILVYVKSI